MYSKNRCNGMFLAYNEGPAVDFRETMMVIGIYTLVQGQVDKRIYRRMSSEMSGMINWTTSEDGGQVGRDLGEAEAESILRGGS